MAFNILVSKARKPKFELILKIFDLNNVPLVSGTSFVKWHLPSSTSAEHRGRTDKAVIKEHKVCWNYEKVLPVRLTMDKTNMLQECLINFEVVQDYSSGSRGEKITLGNVSLNLAEYVEMQGEDGEDGITRRYLMQESKINSTLKVGISMRQTDGERNFIAPPLKTAAVFGGIAGIMGGEQHEQDDMGYIPSINRSREAGELQDMYRRALAASWAAQAGELPADKCIEDLFGGGDGWESIDSEKKMPKPREHRVPRGTQSDEDDSVHEHRKRLHHRRSNSSGSLRSSSTITGKSMANDRGHQYQKSNDRIVERRGHKRGTLSKESMDGMVNESSSESSERGRVAFKHVREVDEFNQRENLVSWELPSGIR